MKKRPNEILKEMRGAKRGMRPLLQDDLNDIHATVPRRINRPVSDYLNGDTRRPLFGLHKLARITEHFMYRVKFGKVSMTRFTEDVERVYFDVRQVIANLIHHWKSDEARLPERVLNRLRVDVTDFTQRCVDLEKAFRTVGRCVCPCCGGTGRIFDVGNAPAAVKRVLDDAVRAGRLGYARSTGYYGI